MTDSKTYVINDADVIITVCGYMKKIDLHITIDFSRLDKDEPDHSNHIIMYYIDLPGYNRGQTYWWSKMHRKVTVKTSSQARRVIKKALVRIDDAIEIAKQKRLQRKSEITSILK